jgi:RimJ/RimL family protein N-acetyltransferase
VIEIRGHRDGELSWIEEKAQVVLTRDARAVVADQDGKIVGMVAFDGWTENAAQAHIAVESPRVWFRLLRPAFHYVYEQARKAIILAVIPSHNVRSVRFVRGIGFRVQLEVRDGWAKGDDLLIFEMRREKCRFLRST